GQYISTRADVVPDPYIERLRTLQDSVPAKPLSVTVDTILQELRLTALDEAFSRFDLVPLATASIAQVHRATLLHACDGVPAGAEVVVKVQHANVGRKVLQDLRDLRLLIHTIGRFEPDYDFSAIIDEARHPDSSPFFACALLLLLWSREVPKELDFINECRNMVEIEKAIDDHNAKFAGVPALHIDCGFPRAIDSLCSERVMVMTYIDGFKLTDKDGMAVSGVNLQSVVLNIIKAYAFQIYVIGFWNSDPHPGNFLVGKSQSGAHIPYLLDFGLTKRATTQEVMALSRVLISAKNADFTTLISAMQDLGLGYFAAENPERVMKTIQFIFRRTSSKQETRLEVEKRREEMLAEGANSKKPRTKKETEEVRKATDAIPGVLIFFSRVIALLRGLSVTLEVPIDYLDVMVPYATLFLDERFRGAKFGLLEVAPVQPPTSTLEDRIATILKTSIDLGHAIGAQVVVYRHGQLLVDVSGGVMGKFDPRPVQKDSLFPVFSCTKAITAAVILHLVKWGKIDVDEPVTTYWPEFIANLPPDSDGYAWKKQITIRHILSHTSGLSKAGSEVLGTNPFAITEWDTMVGLMESAVPEHAPGAASAYHFLSFGWLLGRIAERATGRAFKDLAKEILDASGVEAFGFVGIPNGVESRLASVYWDAAELEDIIRFGTSRLASASIVRPPSSRPMVELDSVSPFAPAAGPGTAAAEAAVLPSDATGVPTATAAVSRLGLNPMIANPTFFNQLNVRRSVIPAASGNFSATGLARFYNSVLASLDAANASAEKPPLYDPVALGAAAAPSSTRGFALGFHRYLFRPRPADPTHGGL
ncbi:hypothetical protein HK405_010596, partial [Cladochytrium tenue]